MDVSATPIIDNHAHPLSQAQPQTPEEFRSHFTEAHSPELARHHVGSAISYRWALKQLAWALQVEATEEAILQRRGAASLGDYARSLVKEANLSQLLVDEGYPSPREAYSSMWMEAMLEVRVGRILRIETLVEELIPEHARFQDALSAFDDRVAGAPEQGFVALKSIAAYRSGLQIGRVSEPDAAAAFDSARAEAEGDRGVRLESKPLIDFFVWRAVSHAATRGLPVQFHTGYGDPDLDLRLSNPLHLRPLFEDRSLEAAPIVLLHESYPFTAEAAYLAAAHPNAYVDIAFSLPPLDRLQLRRSVEAALGTAPTNKVMVSSDGVGIPEHYYLGAVRAREIVSEVLQSMVDGGELTAFEAEDMADLLFRRNAQRTYNLT